MSGHRSPSRNGKVRKRAKSGTGAGASRASKAVWRVTNNAGIIIRFLGYQTRCKLVRCDGRRWTASTNVIGVLILHTAALFAHVSSLTRGGMSSWHQWRLNNAWRRACAYRGASRRRAVRHRAASSKWRNISEENISVINGEMKAAKSMA